MKIERVGDFRMKLGEGPVWDVAEQRLYLTDSLAHEIWRYDPLTGDTQRWTFDAHVGSFAVREGGGLVVAVGDRVVLFDTASGTETTLGLIEADDPVTQLNDGKTDPAGRFLVGTVATNMTGETCGLYAVDRGAIRMLDGGFGLTNGPCFSPDGRTFYFADSRRRMIYAYDYDVAAGTATNRRDFASTERLGGIPDGATTDSEGRLWSAICDGGVLACWRPDGTLDRTIEMPTKLVSSVMFGGASLDQLYVTSIDPGQLPFDTGHAEDGIAGALFVVHGTGARGLPEPRYRG